MAFIRNSELADAAEGIINKYLNNDFSGMEKIIEKYWVRFPGSVKQNMLSLKMLSHFKSSSPGFLLSTLEAWKVNGNLGNQLRWYCNTFRNKSFLNGILKLINKSKLKSIEKGLDDAITKEFDNLDFDKMRYDLHFTKVNYGRLCHKERIEISTANKEGKVSAKKLVHKYVLKEVKDVYKCNGYRKKQLVKKIKDTYEELAKQHLYNSLFDKEYNRDVLSEFNELLNKTRKISFKDLNEEKIFDIYRESKVKRLKTENIINDYSLTNKYTIYKCNKYVKDKFINSLKDIFGYVGVDEREIINVPIEKHEEILLVRNNLVLEERVAASV